MILEKRCKYIIQDFSTLKTTQNFWKPGYEVAFLWAMSMFLNSPKEQK